MSNVKMVEAPDGIEGQGFFATSLDTGLAFIMLIVNKKKFTKKHLQII
jgi:hypothetical protein